MKNSLYGFLAALLAAPAIVVTTSGAVWAQDPAPGDLARVLNTLDSDGDQELSTDEVQQAAERLAGLDADGDGAISLEEMGGPGPIRGMIRGQLAVRVLDADGDLRISEAELAGASRSLARLDTDGDWRLDRGELALGGPNAGAPVATDPENPLFRRMNSWLPSMAGDILPGADGRAFDGYTLIHDAAFGSHNANRIYLTDSEGRTVHEWQPAPYQPEGAVAYLLENGLLLRTVSMHDWMRTEHYPVGATGTIQLLDWDSNIVWQYDIDVPGKHAAHHDVEYMPNGNILAIAYHGFSREEARSMGWDGVYPTGAETIWFDKVLELQPNLQDGSTEIVWQWNSWDHLVQDRFPGRPNFGDVSAATGKIDVNFLRDDYVMFTSGQLHHVNGVDYNAELDEIVLSSAVFGELWFIDHSTTMEEAATDSGGRHGRGGDLIHRWGNPAPTKAGTLDDATLYWQHAPYWIPEGFNGAGNILVFNNGTLRDLNGNHDGEMGMDFENSFSDVLEVAFPRTADGLHDPQRQPEIVWSWNSDASEGYFSPFMSSADRLPNGNTIFVNAHNKQIIEVMPDGERVLDYRVPGPGRKYRVYKYPPDYPAFRDREF